MNNLKEKLKKNGGFTMVELLIVVAIIGILAAVSIPMFNNALEKARHGVDAANARDAISLGTIEVMADLDAKKNFSTWKEYKYVVDDTKNSGNEHQGYLTDDASATAVSANCTSPGANVDGLTVAVKYDNTAGVDENKRIKVIASWGFDTNGHVIRNTNYPTITPP